ncbi:pseudouridine synthase [Chloroflexota bacterium]
MVPESLLKVLTGAGIGSRRRLSEAIKQGRVTVNDVVVEDFRYPVNRETDSILLDGHPVDFKSQPMVYLMLNKPRGVLSTTSDERGRKTVLSCLPQKYRRLRLYPVGRLDKDSTGLLLLTNDGDLTYRLTHPRFEQEKEYLAQLNADLKTVDIRKLEQGIELEEGRTSPTLVRRIGASSSFTCSITIHEGRKRQLRRTFAALGYGVLALKRVREGNLSLGNLPEGTVRELSGQEVQALVGGKG